MFEIKEISLWNGIRHKDYVFHSNTFVYGKNSVGKTALVKVIDHVLGDHRKLDYAGLDNLTEVGAYIKNGSTDLWVKRSLQANTGFFYKRTFRSEYSEISGDSYRDIIQNIIHKDIDSKKIDVYRKVFNETPSYRSFAFMNFIDEINQGDLFSIFTRGKDIRNAVRISNIMQFFFNYKNIEELYEKTLDLERLEEELERTSQEIERYVHYHNIISNLFTKLHLNYQDDYYSDYQTFLEYQRDFNRRKPLRSADLTYLTKASFELSEEIKQYRFMNTQALKTSERKKRDKQLLEGLNVILKKNSDFQKYVKPISDSIKQLDEEGVILTLSDYDASIKAIEEHKNNIDRKINEIKSQAEDLQYDETLKEIALLDDAFGKINKNIDIGKQDKLKDEIKIIKKDIKELKQKADSEQLEDFNNNLTMSYLDVELKGISFINEDLVRNKFYLEFIPGKQEIAVWHNEIVTSKDGSEQSIKVSFDPGSLARHTYIQMLLYLGLHRYLKDYFSEMPILPLLVIDSADQTIQNVYFEKIYPKLVAYAKDYNIQLIFLSKEIPNTVDKNDVVDLSGGLNPFHE